MNQLYNGECIEVMSTLPDGCVDMVFSDEETWEAKDHTKKEWLAFIEQLNSSQFKEIEKFFNTMPKLSHTVKYTNPNTGVENEIVLEGLASFFS